MIKKINVNVNLTSSDVHLAMHAVTGESYNFL